MVEKNEETSQSCYCNATGTDSICATKTSVSTQEMESSDKLCRQDGGLHSLTYSLLSEWIGVQAAREKTFVNAMVRRAKQRYGLPP